jgi:hypothetical protein
MTDGAAADANDARARTEVTVVKNIVNRLW